MKMRMSSKVRQLAKAKGIETLPDLVRAVQAVDPDGKGVSGNSLKRFFYDDRSLTTYEARVVIWLCLVLDCVPGDMLKLEPDTSG